MDKSIKPIENIMLPESVLLLGLTPEESGQVRQMLCSFEIEIESRNVSNLEEAKSYLKDANVCLIVLRVDQTRKRPDQEIRQIRAMLSRQIPILVLIPSERMPETKTYLRSGADDYWVLPLDATAFSIRFYILLEWGQALSHTGTDMVQKGQDDQKRNSDSKKNVVWQQFWNLLHDGLRFFSPKSLVPPPKSSKMIDQWERMRLLGQGGFGEVWLIQKSEKEELAVAKIPYSPKGNIRALRAAAILKRLILHPNVVHLIEVLKEDNKVILIQEYVPGSTLEELLDSGMNPAQKEKAFLQLLSVADYAHRHKIMHRDIKPENIIITPSGNLKILDFGIAKDLSRQSIGTTVAGSRPFMAPEQIIGRSCIASDVWSLGVILYLLSTKSLPFYNRNEKYLMDMILETLPIPPRQLEPSLPEKLEQMILKCLEKDLQKRYPTASELRSDLLKAFPDFGKGHILPEG